MSLQETDDFNELQDYMFSGKNLVKYVKSGTTCRLQVDTRQYSNLNTTLKSKNDRNKSETSKIETKIERKIETTNETKITKNEINDNLFVPKEKDQLFWCYFVMKHGFSTYEYPNTTSFENEKSLKIKCIDDLRLHKQQLKYKKIRNIKEICEDELVNNSQISIKTFTALCVIANMNFLYIDKRKCYPCICEDDEFINVIRKNGNHYTCEMNVPQEKLQEYTTNYFIVDNTEKPLKAMSSYKSHELMELCKKMGILLDETTDKKSNQINEKKKITKEFMYEKLVQSLS
jgi:hypothetical protein